MNGNDLVARKSTAHIAAAQVSEHYRVITAMA